MVQFDTRIPLGIEQPNLLAAMAQGTQNAANQAGLMRQAEGQNVFRQYGAGAMQGDPAALNALAGFDPTMAQGMRLDQRQDARADETLKLAQAAGARAAREAQDRAAAMAEAQQAQGLMRQLAQAYATGNEQAFGAISAEIAGQPLPMEPQSLQTLDAFITGFSGGLSSLAPAPQAPLSPEGKLAADHAAGRITQQQFDQASQKQPLVDMSNMVVGDQGPGVTDKFYEKLDTGQADMFMALLNNGTTVPSRIAQLDQLDSLLRNAPDGAGGALRAFAGNLGIPTEGVSDLQAAQAIINRLVPSQRPPGSGPMSDADLELFKQSLPRLINTREGNQRIIATIRGIAEYEAKQAQIAEQVATRAITPAEGMKALRELSNPLAGTTGSAATSRAREVEINGQRFRVEPIDE